APARADPSDRFRYNPETRKCINARGEEGLNPPARNESDNECADFRGKLVMYFRGARGNFRGANFDGAQFRYLNSFAGGDFTGARLTNIVGDMADLRNANFSGADFTDAQIRAWQEQEQVGFRLKGARFDTATILPFDPKEAEAQGMIAIDEKK